MPGTYPTVGDVLQMRTVCYTASQISVNVYHYRVTAVTTGGASLAEMARAQSIALNAVYKAWMPVEASFRGVGFKNLTPIATIEYPYIEDDGSGTAVGDLTPTQVSGILHLATGLAGPRYRGRVFPGFPSNEWVEVSGALSAPGLVVLSNLATAIGVGEAIVGTTGTTSMRLVVLHRQIGGVPIPGLTNTDTTSITGGSLFATQRRRGQYGRLNAVPF